MKKYIFLWLALFLHCNASAQQFLGNVYKIDSEFLGEEREIIVSLPEGYHNENFYHYPVMYLTDAETQFNHLAATINLLNGTISPMIVVGIKQKQRMQELSPYHLNKKTSQDSENFRQFIINEVKPYIEKKYRTAKFSILNGHSLGGAFVLNAYNQNKEDFNLFLALSPTLAWGNEQLLNELPNTFNLKKQPSLITIFEGQSSFPTPRKTYHAFNNLLKANEHLNKTHRNTILENEDHVSVSHLGTYLALTELYRGWFLSVKEVIKTSSAFDIHYQNLSKKLGYKIKPTESELWQLTQALINANKLDYADLLSRKSQRYYPESKFTYVLSADVAKAKSEIENEKRFLKKAISLSNSDKERQKRYKNRLAKIL